MDFSKLNDFEINKMVAIILGKDLMPDDCQDFGLSGFPEVMLRSGDYKDYCNNPADAWPIFLSKLISVEPDYEFIDPSEEQVFASGAWIAEHFDGKGEHLQYVDINPLRAAMIVFLQMQDSANVPANSTGSDIR
ncbi:DUF2591 domain-containing protein [Salmonella enterica subsp. enterica]|nr:DUF2591 domain-containing protein [Salmonella enterica subsp. enterica]